MVSIVEVAAMGQEYLGRAPIRDPHYYRRLAPVTGPGAEYCAPTHRSRQPAPGDQAQPATETGAVPDLAGPARGGRADQRPARIRPHGSGRHLRGLGALSVVATSERLGAHHAARRADARSRHGCRAALPTQLRRPPPYN